MIMLMFLSFFSCNEDDIKVFDGQAQLYFDKFYMNALQPGTEGADSTVMSFFFYPDDTKTIEAEVVVNYSGLPLTADIPFTLKVIGEGTTANEDEYDLDDQICVSCKTSVGRAIGYSRYDKDSVESVRAVKKNGEGGTVVC